MADTGARGIGTGGGEDIAGPAVIAYTTEDDRHRPVRQAAQAHAREHGCVVVLFAADAAGFMTEPMPNALDAEGAGDRFSDRLGLADLEYLGRSALGDQVNEGRAAGARVAAFLPKGHGMGALAEYVHSVGAHIVYLPGVLAPHDELSALLGVLETPPGVTRPEIEIRVVGPTGSTP